MHKQFIDRSLVELAQRYSVENSDLAIYKELAQIFEAGLIPNSINAYPEINTLSLQYQTRSFIQTTGAKSVYEAIKAYQGLSDIEKPLYPQVLQLLKILLVCPVTSAACERSFSKLRRLKTWLRNTVGQERLNSNIVCNIHKDILMSIDLNNIVSEFAQRSVIRRNMFGTKSINCQN